MYVEKKICIECNNNYIYVCVYIYKLYNIPNIYLNIYSKYIPNIYLFTNPNIYIFMFIHIYIFPLPPSIAQLNAEPNLY